MLYSSPIGGGLLALVWLVTAGADAMRVLRNTLLLTSERQVGGAKLLHPSLLPSSLSAVTWCVRFRLRILGPTGDGRSRIITVADWRNGEQEDGFQLLWFEAGHPTAFFGIGNPVSRSSFNCFLLKDPETQTFNIFAPNTWTHMCIAFEKRTGFIRVVKDGSVLNVNYNDGHLTNVDIPSDFLNKTYLGRCNFDYKGGCTGPGGEYADFNVWSRALDEKELVDWTNCNSRLHGDVLDWRNSTWSLENMEWDDVNDTDVCRPLRPGHVFFAETRNLTRAVSLCRKLRARMSVADSERTQDALMAIFNASKSPQCIDGFWNGYWDEPHEGTFVDVNSGKPVGAFQPWYFGEPNGDTIENCAMVWPARNAWNDLACSNKRCSFCDMSRAPYLNFRGLCYSSRFDIEYSWTGELTNGRFSLSGFSNSRLYWTPDLGKWKLELLDIGRVYATSNASDYPLGTFDWDFYNDDCNDDGAGQQESGHRVVTLNLNACSSSEFNCGDGTCVRMVERCDGLMNCPDRTDEIDCAIVSTDEAYLKDLAAASNVNISVELLAILSIKEVDSRMNLQFIMNLTWFDARLTFLHLRKNTSNALGEDEVNAIWIPQVVFLNTEARDESQLDQKSVVSVQRLGEATRSLPQALSNSYSYRGDSNPLTVSRVFDIGFICNFDMAVYPFDTQMCTAQFVLKDHAGGNFTKLVADGVLYAGPIDLMQYFIKRINMTYFDDGIGSSGVRVEILMGRRLLNELLTTFLITWLICITSFCTNHFHPRYFEAAVTVNLTSLLVLATLFISVSNSLPRTSYIKMIDIWLIFSIAVPFAEVLLQTVEDSLRVESRVRPVAKAAASSSASTTLTTSAASVAVPIVTKKKKTGAAQVMGICRGLSTVGLPSALALFSFVYFFIGLYIRDS